MIIALQRGSLPFFSDEKTLITYWGIQRRVYRFVCRYVYTA